jgi:single-stranded-DNA-specific exonuclease
MAAGLAISEDKLRAFADAFRATARELLSPEDLEPHIRLDHELALSELSLEFLHWHEMFAVRDANPQPLFAREVPPEAPRRVVKNKHLLLNSANEHPSARRLFRRCGRTTSPPPWDIAFVQPDDYGGQRLLRIQPRLTAGCFHRGRVLATHR